MRSQPGDLIHQRRQGPLALLLRAQLERRVASAARDRQQGRDQRGHPSNVLAPWGKQGLELGELLPRVVAGAKPAARSR